MGSGKTQAAITYINEHPEERFIFVTPFLDEASRIKESCPRAHFAEPSDKIPDYHFKKYLHAAALIEEGRNIATTHQAFIRYTPQLLEEICRHEYTLIIDESICVTDEIIITEEDMQIVVDAGVVAEENGVYSLLNESYSGTKFAELAYTLRSRPVVRVSKTKKEGGAEVYYMWTLTRELITSFKNVIVLTYMFDAQEIQLLFKIGDIPYEFIGVKKCEDGNYRFCDYPGDIPEYTKHLKDKIHIECNEKLNAIGENYHAISKNWLLSNSENTRKLGKHVLNYFMNIRKDIPANQRMWSTLKCTKGRLKGKGYTKAFIPFNERATNKYRDRTCLAYAINVFMNVDRKNFYRFYGIEVDREIEEAYALSVMIQWIWRSAIRDGEDIYIYIPSRRMRELLINWMDSLADGDDGDEHSVIYMPTESQGQASGF